MTARATLRDVARLAGVHPGTVSRALNPETEALVNDETARRVRRRPRSSATGPNPIARGLKTNRSLHDRRARPRPHEPAVPADRARDRGPARAGRLHAADRQHRQRPGARAQRLRGDARPPGRRLDHRHRAARPRAARRDGGRRPADRARQPPRSRTARCRRRPPTTTRARGWPSSTWSRSATRRIAHLGGPQDVSTGRAALRGLPRRHGARPGSSPALVRFGAAFTEPEGARAVRGAARRRRAVTAIVAGNDLMALGCYDVLRRARARAARATSRSSASTTCRSPSASTRR